MTDYAILGDLPPDHELRTKQLRSIGAECRNVYSPAWRQVRPSWGIAECCYNDLSAAWTDNTQFRARTTPEGPTP